MLRIALVFLQTKKFCIFYLRNDLLVNALVVLGIPGIFATSALGSGQIGYVASYSCGPSLASGPTFVWIPVLTYVILAIILMIWTVAHIYRVYTI